MISAAWFQENAPIIWNATGGALIVLFLSIISPSKRSWLHLTVGMIFGAFGASFVGYAFQDEWWVFPAAGAAAIMTENLALGVMNLSAKFRDNPVDILTHFVKLFVPIVNKTPPGHGHFDPYNPHQPYNPHDPSFGSDGPVYPIEDSEDSNRDGPVG